MFLCGDHLIIFISCHSISPARNDRIPTLTCVERYYPDVQLPSSNFGLVRYGANELSDRLLVFRLNNSIDYQGQTQGLPQRRAQV